MNRGSRPFLILFASLVLLMLCAGLALAITVHRSGMVAVDVQASGPGGCDIRGLRVPGFLVGTALEFIPNRVFAEAADEMREAGPVLREVCRTLRGAPDGCLVEITGADQHVSVTKHGGDLVVDVQDEEQSVHVVMPLRTLERMARRFGSI